jgi:hypothetical protein
MRRVLQLTALVGGVCLLLLATFLLLFRSDTITGIILIHEGSVNNEGRIFVSAPEMGWSRLLSNIPGDSHYHAYFETEQWLYYSGLDYQTGASALFRTQLFGSRTEHLGRIYDSNSVVISPDRRWLAYMAPNTQGGLPIYVISESNGENQISLANRLPASSRITSSQLWITPDSQWLMFNLYDTQSSRADIWRVRPNGTDLQNLTAGYPSSVSLQYVHPTQAEGLFVSVDFQLHWMDFEGTNLRALPFLAPDAQTREVYEPDNLILFDSPEGTVVVNSADGSLIWELEQAWDSVSVDKAWIILTEQDRVMGTNGVVISNRHLRPARLSNGQPRTQLPNAHHIMMTLGETPDGQWFIYSASSMPHTPIFELWRAQDQLVAERLTSGHSIQLIGWTPDHEWILYTQVDAPGIATFYRIQPDGTGKQAFAYGDAPNFPILAWAEWEGRNWSTPFLFFVSSGLLVSAILFRRRA